MSRQVFCVYLQKEAAGLDFQLYPGSLAKKSSIASAKKPGLYGKPNKLC